MSIDDSTQIQIEAHRQAGPRSVEVRLSRGTVVGWSEGAPLVSQNGSIVRLPARTTGAIGIGQQVEVSQTSIDARPSRPLPKPARSPFIYVPKKPGGLLQLLYLVQNPANGSTDLYVGGHQETPELVTQFSYQGVAPNYLNSRAVISNRGGGGWIVGTIGTFFVDGQSRTINRTIGSDGLLDDRFVNTGNSKYFTQHIGHGWWASANVSAVLDYPGNAGFSPMFASVAYAEGIVDPENITDYGRDTEPGNAQAISNAQSANWYRNNPPAFTTGAMNMTQESLFPPGGQRLLITGNHSGSTWVLPTRSLPEAGSYSYDGFTSFETTFSSVAFSISGNRWLQVLINDALDHAIAFQGAVSHTSSESGIPPNSVGTSSFYLVSQTELIPISLDAIPINEADTWFDRYGQIYSTLIPSTRQFLNLVGTTVYAVPRFLNGLGGVIPIAAQNVATGERSTIQVESFALPPGATIISGSYHPD